MALTKRELVPVVNPFKDARTRGYQERHDPLMSAISRQHKGRLCELDGPMVDRELRIGPREEHLNKGGVPPRASEVQRNEATLNSNARIGTPAAKLGSRLDEVVAARRYKRRLARASHNVAVGAGIAQRAHQ